MDNRLFITVLFVTLAWMSAGAYAQTTTMAPNNTTNNMTTVAPNNTTNNMTTMAPNNTTKTMTTVAPDNTTNNMTNTMTTMAPNNMTNNMTNTMTTMAPNNMTNNMTNTMTTMAPNNMTNNMTNTMTTMAPNNMTNNMTTMAPNNMTNNMTTMAPNTTVAPAVSTAAPTGTPSLVTNTTVTDLPEPISNTGCGTERLCAAEPAGCNPAVPGSCFFIAAKQRSGQNFDFGLSGESEGYVAASVSTDSTLGGNDRTYVCANNNGTVQYFSTLLNNGVLTVTELPVNSVKGRVNGSRIQCSFQATLPTLTTRTTTFSLGVSTGPFNTTTGGLGRPSTQIRTNLVDLSNPNATVTNLATANPTTAAPATTVPNTTSHAITLQQSVTKALLITVAALVLALL